MWVSLAVAGVMLIALIGVGAYALATPYRWTLVVEPEVTKQVPQLDGT